MFETWPWNAIEIFYVKQHHLVLYYMLVILTE